MTVLWLLRRLNGISLSPSSKEETSAEKLPKYLHRNVTSKSKFENTFQFPDLKPFRNIYYQVLETISVFMFPQFHNPMLYFDLEPDFTAAVILRTSESCKLSIEDWIPARAKVATT